VYDVKALEVILQDNMPYVCTEKEKMSENFLKHNNN
jgi:hypothetical protein